MAFPPGIAKVGPRQFPRGLVNADFFIKYARDHDEAGHLLSQNREFAFFERSQAYRPRINTRYLTLAA